MQFDLFRNTPDWYKLIVTAFVVLSSLMFFYLIAILISVPFFNTDINELLNNSLVIENDVHLLKYFQFIQTTGTFLIPSFILGYFFSGSSLSYLTLNNKPILLTSLLVIITVLISIPLINYSGYLNSKLDLPDFFNKLEEKMITLQDETSEITELLLSRSSGFDIFINLLVIAIIPALGEELLFRGVIQRVLIDLVKNKHIGIILTSVIFSLLHLQIFGFLPRFLLSLLFGYLFLWSRSIWIPILAHFVNNCTIVLFYSFTKEESKKVIDEIGLRHDDILFLIISLIAVVFLLMFIFYHEKVNKPSV